MRGKQFYTTLESLQKDREEVELQSRELEKQRDEELELERRKEQEARKSKSSRAPSASSRTASRRRGSSVKPGERTAGSKEDGPADGALVKKRTATGKEAKKTTPAVAPRAAGRTKGHSSLITSTTALLSRMQAYMATNSGPLSMIQTIVMLMVIAWMTNNKRMRDRIKRFLALWWIKLARTVGMGMKVTYV